MDKKTSKRSGQYRWNFLQNFANPLLSSTKEYLAVASRPQGIVRHLCQFYNSYNFLFYKEHQGLFWSLILILGNQRCKKVSLLIFSMTTRCTCCLLLFTPPKQLPAMVMSILPVFLPWAHFNGSVPHSPEGWNKGEAKDPGEGGVRKKGGTSYSCMYNI